MEIICDQAVVILLLLKDIRIGSYHCNEWVKVTNNQGMSMEQCARSELGNNTNAKVDACHASPSPSKPICMNITVTGEYTHNGTTYAMKDPAVHINIKELALCTFRHFW